jgi:NADH-quinone oxidoreductase subunit C
MSTHVVKTSPDDWLDTCRDYAQRGLQVVDWLTAIDRIDHVEVVVNLVQPGTADSILVSCEIDPDSATLPSLAEVFPGADWHEREMAEMFGISFANRDSTDPLLLREPMSPPLRKNYALKNRVDVTWPGAEQSSARKRRKLPPGVRPDWVNADE